MAKGDKEHQMLFDLRGKRRNVVKVVYATLAVLMGLSLFLVIGGFNIAELFDSNASSGNAAEPFEEQAERIETRIKKEPEDPNLLLSLTRARVNAGNANVTVEPNGERAYSLEALQQWELADQAWAEYLEATDEPNAGLAVLVAPMLLQLAELSRTVTQAAGRVETAAEAQKIVSELRPSVNSFSTLSLYTLFTGDYKAAEEAEAKAKKLAASKEEREAIEKQLDETKKRAVTFRKSVARAEKLEKAARNGGGGANPESIENPLGEAFGGGGLTE